MVVREPRYSKEEFARHGDAIYESQVRSQVEEGNYDKIVAIDFATGSLLYALKKPHTLCVSLLHSQNRDGKLYYMNLLALELVGIVKYNLCISELSKWDS